MNKIANRQVMCDVFIKSAPQNNDLVILTSDSRGSASLNAFAQKYPDRIVETGIAEQNIVSIAAGLAHSGKRPFVCSPACFLSMRSIEQIKVDVAYSNTNVKLIGISGGVSYGALGMSHHSLQDIAVTTAIPNLEVIIPADRFETEAVFEYLLHSNKPAYVRLGRNAVADCYTEKPNFQIGKADILNFGEKIAIIATGEMVNVANEAGKILNATVINCASLKPFDYKTIKTQLENKKLVISLEEHSEFGGLGSLVARTISENAIGIKHILLSIPDEPAVAGTSQEIFNHYGLNVDNVIEVAKRNV